MRTYAMRTRLERYPSTIASSAGQKQCGVAVNVAVSVAVNRHCEASTRYSPTHHGVVDTDGIAMLHIDCYRYLFQSHTPILRYPGQTPGQQS